MPGQRTVQRFLCWTSQAQPTIMWSTESTVMITSIEPATETAKLVEGKADLLIIAHPNFINGLSQLVAAREAQGYRVKIVNVEHIYAQYNNGIVDAQPIRSISPKRQRR